MLHTENEIKTQNFELAAGDISLNLEQLQGPSLKVLLNSALTSESKEVEISKADKPSNNCKVNDNLDKAAWTISAGLLAEGMNKLVALGYISPQAAIAAGVSIGGVILVKKLYKYFSYQ